MSDPGGRRWPSVVLTLVGMLGVGFLGLLSMAANIHEDSCYSPAAHLVNLVGAVTMLVAAVLMHDDLRVGRQTAIAGLLIGLVGAGINFYLATQVCTGP